MKNIQLSICLLIQSVICPGIEFQDYLNATRLVEIAKTDRFTIHDSTPVFRDPSSEWLVYSISKTNNSSVKSYLLIKYDFFLNLNIENDKFLETVQSPSVIKHLQKAGAPNNSTGSSSSTMSSSPSKKYQNFKIILLGRNDDFTDEENNNDDSIREPRLLEEAIKAIISNFRIYSENFIDSLFQYLQKGVRQTKRNKLQINKVERKTSSSSSSNTNPVLREIPTPSFNNSYNFNSNETVENPNSSLSEDNKTNLTKFTQTKLNDVVNPSDIKLIGITQNLSFLENKNCSFDLNIESVNLHIGTYKLDKLPKVKQMFNTQHIKNNEISLYKLLLEDISDVLDSNIPFIDNLNLLNAKINYTKQLKAKNNEEKLKNSKKNMKRKNKPKQKESPELIYTNNANVETKEELKKLRIQEMLERNTSLLKINRNLNGKINYNQIKIEINNVKVSELDKHDFEDKTFYFTKFKEAALGELLGVVEDNLKISILGIKNYLEVDIQNKYGKSSTWEFSDSYYVYLVRLKEEINILRKDIKHMFQSGGYFYLSNLHFKSKVLFMFQYKQLKNSVNKLDIELQDFIRNIQFSGKQIAAIKDKSKIYVWRSVEEWLNPEETVNSEGKYKSEEVLVGKDDKITMLKETSKYEQDKFELKEIPNFEKTLKYFAETFYASKGQQELLYRANVLLYIYRLGFDIIVENIQKTVGLN